AVLLTQREVPTDHDAAVRLSWRGFWLRVGQAIRLPGTGWLVAFVATYKMGEALAGKMFVPFLVKHDIAPEVAAAWMGKWVAVAFMALVFPMRNAAPSGP